MRRLHSLGEWKVSVVGLFFEHGRDLLCEVSVAATMSSGVAELGGNVTLDAWLTWQTGCLWDMFLRQ